MLGALVEKAATTPEHYPLSSKALTQACNQKNNRDPITDYSEREVDAVLLELRQAGLARTVHTTGARVPKHRHVLDEAWGLSAPELAVLAVTMLRGPNTLNELASRTERYVTIGDAATMRAVIAGLQQRDPPLLEELPRLPGQRETRFAHQLLDDDLARPRPDPVAPTGPTDESPMLPPVATAPVPADELAALRADLAALEARFDELIRRLGESL